MSALVRWLGLFLLLVVATAATAFMAMVVVGEDNLHELKAGNQWLVRDLAQQFSQQSAKSLQLLNRIGTMLVASGSGDDGGTVGGVSTFSSEVRREFELDSSIKGLYLYDPSSAEPLSRLEKPGMVLAAGANAGTTASSATGNSATGNSATGNSATKIALKELVDQTVQKVQGLRLIGAGLSAMAVRLGELPRVLVLVFDGAAMMKADGGPNGEKWMILADDRTALFEGQADAGVSYPPTAEIAEISKSENPAGERSEWSKEWQATNGSMYQIDAIQTGFAGVSALALVPIDQSSKYLPFLLQMSLGVSFLLTALVFFFRSVRTFVGAARREKVSAPVAANPDQSESAPF